MKALNEPIACMTNRKDPTVMAPIAFSARLQAKPEVDMQLAAFCLVTPDVAVNGLMADLEIVSRGRMAAKMAGHLAGCYTRM